MGISKFSIIWDTKVKPVALECIEGRVEIIKECERIEAIQNVEEQEKANVELNKKYGDIYGIDVISNFIWAIEHDLADGAIRLNGLNQLMMVRGCLAANNDSYWTNVWHNDLSSERAKKFLKLGELVAELQTLL